MTIPTSAGFGWWEKLRLSETLTFWKWRVIFQRRFPSVLLLQQEFIQAKMPFAPITIISAIEAAPQDNAIFKICHYGFQQTSFCST